jgi:hypothetical protein
MTGSGSREYILRTRLLRFSEEDKLADGPTGMIRLGERPKVRIPTFGCAKNGAPGRENARRNLELLLLALKGKREEWRGNREK